MFILKWGTPGVADGQFQNPRGVAVGQDGTVYVADAGNQRVQRFTSNGTYLSQWSTDIGPTSGPRDIAVDLAGNVYTVGSHVQKFTASGVPITNWKLEVPYQAIAVDGVRGFVYVSVLEFVRKFSTAGDSLDTWVVGPGGTIEESNNGIGIDLSGNVYIMGGTTGTLRLFTSDGAFVRAWNVPHGIRVGIDVNGDVYVTGEDQVRRYASDGSLLVSWGGFGTGDGEFNRPWGIAFDDDGAIYVCDYGNYRIQKFGFVPTPVRPTTWGRVKAQYLR